MKTEKVFFEWTYNPWIKDRFRTSGRFILIILLGLLSGYLFNLHDSKLNSFVIPAIILIFAFNLRSFIESHFTIEEHCIRPDVGKAIAFTDIIGWRIGAKYLRIVVGRLNLRRELVCWELPDNTKELEKIMLDKVGQMLESNDQIKSALKIE